ncbi:MAG TPA: hypothetical protein VG389_29610 [Myxococcota bacterium]|nr:hypothetical protein [Myxococcota bacterium]
MPRRGPLAAGLALSAALLGSARDAKACETLRFELTPAAALQVAIWLTDRDANPVDTVAVTAATATYGLGNRPGRLSTAPGGGFPSHYRWPEGKRLEVLPVWAYGRGVLYPMLVMQDGIEDWLDFHEATSSPDPYYCIPMLTSLPLDAVTCASPGYRDDKGAFDGAAWVPYPPRADLGMPSKYDSADVMLFADVNDLDAVSIATAGTGVPLTVAYDAAGLSAGDYLAWVEVNREDDANASWYGSDGAGPLPCFFDPILPEFGVCRTGQPSVVWRVAVALEPGAQTLAAGTLDYVGYGAPSGADGTLRPPDATITEGVDGSGAGRLRAFAGPAGDVRFLVTCADPPASDAGTRDAGPSPDAAATDSAAADDGPTRPGCGCACAAAGAGRHQRVSGVVLALAVGGVVAGASARGRSARGPRSVPSRRDAGRSAGCGP